MTSLEFDGQFNEENIYIWRKIFKTCGLFPSSHKTVHQKRNKNLSKIVKGEKKDYISKYEIRMSGWSI